MYRFILFEIYFIPTNKNRRSDITNRERVKKKKKRKIFRVPVYFYHPTLDIILKKRERRNGLKPIEPVFPE